MQQRVALITTVNYIVSNKLPSTPWYRQKDHHRKQSR